MGVNCRWLARYVPSAARTTVFSSFPWCRSCTCYGPIRRHVPPVAHTAIVPSGGAYRRCLPFYVPSGGAYHQWLALLCSIMRHSIPSCGVYRRCLALICPIRLSLPPVASLFICLFCF
ncbi:hypothetical protein AVEN_22585-1 [Araneus ventricosus]|uniref:Uncharacterized protein n=1 Tax=Araneus ventricosus TaxID=182803 RepID=A0A4Y2E7E5_ARAVE|nr:hypothetical protein AVEN_22585-1 [Araneus ventricosus]